MSKNVLNKYNPDQVSFPGETLLEALNERSMTQADLARRMGRPNKTVNEIIQGKSAITSETALQLENVLGISATFWLNRQRYYDEYIAKEQERTRLSKMEDWIERFPIKKMAELGWIQVLDDKVNQTIELLRYFGVASPSQWDVISQKTVASFRLARSYDSDIEDITVWLRKGELLAQEIPCEPFNQQKFISLLKSEIRALTREKPAIYQQKLQSLCASAGVAVVFVPQLPKARVSGATRWLSPEKAIIQLSLRYKTDDHLWFTFYHEAGHIVLHGKKDIYLETINAKSLETKEKEEEVDKFAAEILISEKDLSRFLDSIPPDQYPSKESIIKFADDIGIAPSIVVGRLQHDKLPVEKPVPYSYYHDLKAHLEWIKP
ncbi:MAG: HigA family addiction module antidote protein [Anaerolineaceae bacterium]|nr:HigA family addiction module antidote protein [Anaerolineaceae bacterium]